MSASSLTLSLILHVADPESHGRLLLSGPVPGTDGLGHHLLPLQHLALGVVSTARFTGLSSAAARQKEHVSLFTYTGLDALKMKGLQLT